MTTHGGARTKVRQDDRRGGARPGAGALQKRIHLTPVSARQLRTLAEDADITPTEMATRLVLEAYSKMLDGTGQAAIASGLVNAQLSRQLDDERRRDENRRYVADHIAAAADLDER